MKKNNKIENSATQTETVTWLTEFTCIDDLHGFPAGKYDVMLGWGGTVKMYVGDRRPEEGDSIVIGTVTIPKATGKGYAEAAKAVRGIRKAMTKVTKSTVIKTWGKEAASKAPVWSWVANPHYSSGSNMVIYAVPVLEHLYGKREIER